jgi:hypothetical protein
MTPKHCREPNEAIESLLSGCRLKKIKCNCHCLHMPKTLDLFQISDRSP